MPSPVTTANMGLTEPGVGVTLSPSWALLMNANMATIDQHNHTTGMGVLVPVAGLDINADLPLNSHNITLLNSAVFAGAASGTPSILSLYSNGTDLFYKDVNGNAIRLTEGGSPASGTGNIQGLPSTPTGDAGILWVNAQSTFQLLKDSGSVGANLDAGTIVIRYPGSYPTPSGNYIALQAPTALATGYSLTMSATLPATAASLLLTNASGIQSYLSKGSANTVLRVNSAGTNVEYSTIDTANISSLAVTNAKIANGTIEPVKLALNRASASFSFTSTTAGPTNVTGASVTINNLSGVRPLLISVQGSVGTPTSFSVRNTVSEGEGILYIVEDGSTSLQEALMGSVAGTALGVSQKALFPVLFQFIHFPTSGSHTYTLQISVHDVPGGSTTTVDLDSGILTVTEL